VSAPAVETSAPFDKTTTPGDDQTTTPGDQTAMATGLAVQSEFVPVSDLPSMFIELTDPVEEYNTLDYVHADKDNEVLATVNLVDPDNPAYTLTDLNGVFEGRGNFTWRLDKKPYQIKLKTATEVLGMASHRTWVLLANHADPSLMRNKIAYDLATDFGLAYSPETRYVDLTVNGEYLGNYLLSEKTEVGTNRVELTTDEGILTELDNNYGTAEDTYFYTDESGTIFVLKDSVLDDDIPLSAELATAWTGLENHINEFEAELYAPNPDWDNIAALIDVESFIKYYFVAEVAENSDVRVSSVYFYRDGPGDVLHAGPVWDLDIAFANRTPEYLGGNPTADYLKNLVFYLGDGNDWFAQLFRNEEFVQAASDMYSAELADDIADLPSDIDALETELAASAAENFALWDDVLGEPSVFGSSGHLIGDTWEGEVDYLRDWVEERITYLNTAYGPDLPLLQYPAHVATIGWVSEVTNGMMTDTVGRALAVEALRLNVSDTALVGQVTANAHVQNVGWTGWIPEGDLVGTTGRALDLEAIQIKLTQELAHYYDVSYRVHVQNIGWMDWVTNGATAGTTGRALQVEAIQLRLTTKENPGAYSSTVYNSHVETIGWMPEVSDGEVSGTTGRALRMEALELRVESTEHSGDIHYRAHVENIGWMPWQTSATLIGTTGKALRMEAVEIKLTGQLAEHYTIRYRAHVQDVGWQPYSYDGQTAGTTGQAKRIEAITIDLIPTTL